MCFATHTNEKMDEKQYVEHARESQSSPEHVELEVKEKAGLPDDFVPATPQEEAAVIRKLDWHLMPFVFLLYTLAVLDRSNLGNAKLAGLENAIDLKGWNYNWLGTLFYISCTLLPSLFQYEADKDQISAHNGC